MKTVTSDADAGAGSLRQTITDAVDGDLIIFATGIDTILVGDPLLLGDKTLTIGSMDSAMVVLDGMLLGDGTDTNRVVTVTGVTGKTVTMVNLSIENGYAKDTVWSGDVPSGDNGGGLLVNMLDGGNFVGRDLTFLKNKSEGRGGGLYASGPSYFTGCTFTENSALDADEGDGGGALMDTLAVMDSSYFTLNVAGDHAGGMHIRDSEVKVSYLTFEGNECADDGGALYIWGAEAMEITARNNIAGDHGGAIYMTSEVPLPVLTTAVLEDNECGDDGGGLYLNHGMATGITATNNTSVDHAGGVYVNSVDASLENSTLTGNTAGDDGGGLYLNHSMATGITSTNNTSVDHAGGVYVNNESKLYNSTITGNYSGDDGGGIYQNDSACVVQNCYIANNESFDHAGGIMVRGGAVINCIVDGNTAGDDGGGINMDSSIDTDTGDTTDITGVIGCVVTNNKCIDSGGGMSVQLGKVINTTISNNFGKNGGGVRAQQGPWQIVNTIIYGNDASDSRKNIRYESNTYVVGLNYCVVDTNSYANRDLTPENSTNMIVLENSPFIGGMGGNAYYLPGGSSLIDAGTHTDVSAMFPAEDAHGNTRVVNSVIDIGAFEAFQGMGLVVTSEANSGANTLRDVIAGASDGDTITFSGVDTIFVDLPIELGDKTLYIDGSTTGENVVLDGRFNDSTHLDTNRVITVMGETGRIVSLNNLTIQYGNAKDVTSELDEAPNQGGGLWADTRALNAGLTVMDSKFYMNGAEGRGGGAYSRGGTNLFENCTFLENDARDDRGGGAAGYYTVFEGCTFTDNHAGTRGGGVLVQEGSLVNNSVVEGNVAEDRGGGGYANEGGMITNSTFTNNESKSDDGGGIYLSEAGYADNVTVTGNTAGDRGGGIAIRTHSWVKNSTITGNYAADDGGGVDLVDTLGLIENCVISGNESVDYGGGLYLQSGNAINCVIDGNDGGDDGGGVRMGMLEYTGYFPGANLIGSIVSNNSSVDKGGGVAILYGNIVNCHIVNNTAPADNDGSGVRGDGTWKIINSIIYGNTPAPNILISGNTEAVTVMYSALEAGHGLTTEIANSVDLAASPFVGGTGADSLHLSNMAPVDAGSVDVALAIKDKVSDVIPANDIDGDPRIVGTIDMGVYETEKPVVAATGVTLDLDALSVKVAATGALVATVAPSEATDKSISWSTADAAVATVADGTVTGVAVGTAYVYVTTTDGGFKDSCLVTVTSDVGINDFEASGFKLYPNPVTEGVLYIKLSDNEVTSLEIYNTLGVLVHRVSVNNRTLIEVNTTALLEKGVYFIRVSKQDSNYLERFIVQ
ncbi:T9SS type A sorting domain-containing protein [Bacteroidota bacterium]